MKFLALLLLITLSAVAVEAFVAATRAVKSPGFSLGNLQKKKATPVKKAKSTTASKKPAFSFGGKKATPPASKVKKPAFSLGRKKIGINKKVAMKKPVVKRAGASKSVKKIAPKDKRLPNNPFGFAKVAAPKDIIKVTAVSKPNGGFSVSVAKAPGGKVPDFIA